MLLQSNRGINEASQFKSQDVTEVSTIIILRHWEISRFGIISAGPVPFLEAPVLKDEQHTQTKCKKSREKHKSSTNGHALNKARGLGVGKDIGAQERAALPDNVEQNNASTPAGIGALIV